jgi:hypothetical protein
MIFFFLNVLFWVIIISNVAKGRIKIIGWLEDWGLVINIIIVVLAPLTLIHVMPNEMVIDKKQKIYPILTDAAQVYLVKTTDDNSYWYFVEKTEAPACQSLKHQNVTIEYLLPGMTSGYFLEKRKHFKNKILDLLFNTPAWHQPQIIFKVPPGSIAKVIRQ